MRRFSAARFRPRGTTLIELAVATCIVGLLMIEIWGMMHYGARYMKRSNETLELQISTLKALSWMSRELAESSPISVRNETDGSYPTKGLVFGVPRDENGNLVHDANGRLRWMALVSYYIDDTPGQRPRLMRAVEPWPAGPSAPINPIPPSQGADHFRTSAAIINRRVVAVGVTDLIVTPSGDSLRVEMMTENETKDTAIESMTVLDLRN